MDKRDIKAIFDRARFKASIQKEAEQRRAEAMAKAAEEAKQAAIKERVNRFLTDDLEKAITQALASGQSKAILFEGDDNDTAFVLALSTELQATGCKVSVSHFTEPSSKIGYGRGDDFEKVVRVYLELDSLPR